MALHDPAATGLAAPPPAGTHKIGETQIIVFASQKGGSGKTTLSGHIAVAAEQAGAGPVAMIDTDPQSSLAHWWNARVSDTPVFAQTSIQDLGEAIAHLKRAGFRLIVIDTPPAVTATIAEVIAHASLVIVPTRPSPHDLRAVGATVDIVEHQRKPLIFVVNAANARARITSETAVALSQHGTVAPVTLHHRIDFAASMIDGRTVGEVDRGSRSAHEIQQLWTYLADRLLRLRGGADAADTPRLTIETDLLTPFGGALPIEDSEEAPLLAAPADPDKASAPTRPHQTSRPTATLEPDPEPRDGIDRRKLDKGPPAGMFERRQNVPVFGRRGLNSKTLAGNKPGGWR